jgi:hypothetical protein
VRIREGRSRFFNLPTQAVEDLVQLVNADLFAHEFLEVGVVGEDENLCLFTQFREHGEEGFGSLVIRRSSRISGMAW